MPTGSGPVPPPPPAEPPEGVTGQLSRLTSLLDNGSEVLTPALPKNLVDRGGQVEAAGAAAVPESTQPASAVVEHMQQRLLPVFLGKEGHRLPSLMRSFTSVSVLRMNIKERAGQGLDSVGNAEQLEGASLCLLAAYDEDPRARALLRESTPDFINALARLRFLKDNYSILLGACEIVRGAVVAQEHEVNDFVRDGMLRLGSLEDLSPRMRNLLQPARAFVSGPAQKGQETKHDRDKAFKAGYDKARAEEALRVASGAAKANFAPGAPAAAEPAPAPPAEPVNRRRTR